MNNDNDDDAAAADYAADIEQTKEPILIKKIKLE